MATCAGCSKYIQCMCGKQRTMAFDFKKCYERVDFPQSFLYLTKVIHICSADCKDLFNQKFEQVNVNTEEISRMRHMEDYYCN